MKISLPALTVALLASALAVGCNPSSKSAITADTKSSAKIIGGEEPKADDSWAQSVVAVNFKGELEGGLCSATLISDTLALTAAHCVKRMAQPEDGYLVFEKDVKKKERVTRQITQIRFPDEFVEEDSNADIAIVKFKGGLPEGYQPMMVLPAEAEHFIIPSVSFRMAGFGYTEFKTGDSSSGKGEGKLRSIERPVRAIMPESGYLKTYQDPTRSTCFGDSGGPALIMIYGDWYIAGVISGSEKVEDPENPGTYLPSCGEDGNITKTYYWESWVQKTIAELEALSS